MKRDPQTVSKIMASIKSKDTAPELMLGRAMWKRGLRYRKHYKIFGKPDFVFVSKKIAIFCDGDFWHGNNWRLRSFDSLEDELATYTDYWKQKILRNIKRDQLVNDKLRSDGWLVLRFWESDILKAPETCVEKNL